MWDPLMDPSRVLHETGNSSAAVGLSADRGLLGEARVPEAIIAYESLWTGTWTCIKSRVQQTMRRSCLARLELDPLQV